MKKSLFAAFAAAVLCCAPIQAESARKLEDILPIELCAALRQEGRLQKSLFRQENGVSYEYLPQGALSDSAKAYWSADSCNYMNESLFLYKKSAAAARLDLEESGKTIEGILKSVSALEGITYFSNSRQEERLLYKRAFCISDAETKTPLPDPVGEEIDGLSALVLLEDLTFGENLYSFLYQKKGSQISLFFANETPLKFMVFTGIRPKELKSALLVEDLGDEILFYGLVRANYRSIPGIRGRIDASISSRMDAMYKWFASAYETRAG